MKLNLLPTYVSKGSQAKTATVVSVLLALLGILGAVGLIIISKERVSSARQNAQDKMQAAAQAVAISKEADQVVNDAQMIIRNINLADAMLKHNDVYPDLYRDLKPYIPGFFRITNMSANPIDAQNTNITLTGTVKTFQQYADLMIALYRFPGATTVSRAGYVNGDPFIPNITDTDQNGRPIKPGQDNIPDDKMQRLTYFEGQGSLTGYAGLNGYGSGDNTEAKGAMPGYSLVTVAIVVPRPLQTPDPRATLQSQGSAPAPGTGGGGGGVNPAPPTGGGSTGPVPGGAEDR